MTGARHPDDGAWRAWLDGEPDPGLAAHREQCAECAARVAGLEADRAWASQVLAGRTEMMSPAALAAAREGVLARAGIARQDDPELTGEAGIMTRIKRRWQLTAGLAAAALALVAVAFTPVGQTAFAEFLGQFRSERFAVVPLDQYQISQAMVELESLGTVDASRDGLNLQRMSPEEAAAVTGFDLRQPDPAVLPAGLTERAVDVSQPLELRFTPDKAKADAYLESVGSDLRLPEELDGRTLLLQMPAATLTTYTGVAEPTVDDFAGDITLARGLLVGQGRPLTAEVEGGGDLEAMRAFLLELPGLPDSIADRLRNLDDWTRTLPIPVAIDETHWQETTIQGAPALVLDDETGIASAAIWNDGGQIIGVAGPMRPDELRTIAESIR